MGLSITAGGVCGVLARPAVKADPTYQGLKAAINASPAVVPDETGWKIGWPGWLWVFATPLVTVCSIDHERSFAAATKVLNPDYGGAITRDGWSVYPGFRNAVHQSCLQDLLRRACGPIEAQARGHTTVPVILRDLLLDALDLRNRRDAGEIAGTDFEAELAGLEGRVQAPIARRGHTEENRRLLKHLRKEAPPC